MDVRFDLHAHTTASDGTSSPADLVRRAARLGLAAVAITDHDSVEGVSEALATARAECPSLTVVPGVELSAVADGRDVHILGYFVDHENAVLRAHLADLRRARLNRAESIVDALAAAGYRVSLDRVLSLSDGGAVGRSHVARALVDEGHAEDVSDAFHRLLGRGRPFYVPKDVRTPSEALRVVADSGGIPVLAHPAVTAIDDLIPQLVHEGLGGLEAYHPNHGPEDEERYLGLAARLGLLVTGGSDYHGELAPTPALGSLEMPAKVLSALLEAGSSLRR
ncbi:MAG TPA: PHP domain-containing protein [Coriobacteriia bacterium]|nr:PHP domain-containing protein [Coriobacteriia bacterium]